MQKIIKNDSTLDRPEFRITTHEVFMIAKEIKQPFTTNDIADVIVSSGKHRGVGYNRIERGVRAGMSWLVQRSIAYEDGHKVYKTNMGTISKPFLYALFPDAEWHEKTKAVFDCESIDLLNRVFVMR